MVRPFPFRKGDAGNTKEDRLLSGIVQTPAHRCGILARHLPGSRMEPLTTYCRCCKKRTIHLCLRDRDDLLFWCQGCHRVWLITIHGGISRDHGDPRGTALRRLPFTAFWLFAHTGNPNPVELPE